MAAGFSSAICIRFSSSRQDSPASTRMRVRLLDTIVLFPLEPEASTVIRIIQKAYSVLLLKKGPYPNRCQPGYSHYSVLVKSAARFAPQPPRIHHANQ